MYVPLSLCQAALAHAVLVDATIAFGSGLTAAWSGVLLGSLKMSDVKVIPDVGAVIDTQSTFEVADVGNLTDFT